MVGTCNTPHALMGTAMTLGSRVLRPVRLFWTVFGPARLA